MATGWDGQIVVRRPKRPTECVENSKTYQVQEPFSLSSPVPHSVRSTTSSSCHPANRGAWSRIEREEQRYILVLEVFVEIFPFHASLDDRISVCLGYLEDFVHEREIEGDSAEWLGSVCARQGEARSVRVGER